VITELYKVGLNQIAHVGALCPTESNFGSHRFPLPVVSPIVILFSFSYSNMKSVLRKEL